MVSNLAFERFDFRRRRWLLPPFVRITLPLPVTRERLAAALYVFSLYFFCFFATNRTPYKHVSTAQSVRRKNLWPADRTGSRYFFSGAGARTISIVRPSM